MTHQPKRPPRLRMVFPKYRNPIYFVTIGSLDHRKILANDATHTALIEFSHKLAARGTALGRYVIMPDHIHFFIRLNQTDRLGPTVGFLKRALSASLKRSGVNGAHWQPGFFDHLLRSANSYSEKWDYVRNNPVRAGLVKAPEDWPYANEIMALSF